MERKFIAQQRTILVLNFIFFFFHPSFSHNLSKSKQIKKKKGRSLHFVSAGGSNYSHTPAVTPVFATYRSPPLTTYSLPSISYSQLAAAMPLSSASLYICTD